jgi:DNA-directed RNA polymerase subunit H (RpoH/RPB5)
MQTPAQSFYKARTNVIAMMMDRGYKMIDSQETKDLEKLNISEEEFGVLFHAPGEKDLTNISGIQTKDGIPVFVTFKNKVYEKIDDIFKEATDGVITTIAAKMGVPGVKTKETLRNFLKDHRVIIVFLAHRNKNNEYCTTVEKSLLEHSNLELWPVHRLQVNIPKHILNKPQVILSNEDKQAVLHRFNLNAAMMPEICIDDPMNRWYDGRVGEVYKEYTGYTPQYRIVVGRRMPLRKK